MSGERYSTVLVLLSFAAGCVCGLKVLREFDK